MCVDAHACGRWKGAGVCAAERKMQSTCQQQYAHLLPSTCQQQQYAHGYLAQALGVHALGSTQALYTAGGTAGTHTGRHRPTQACIYIAGGPLALEH